MGTRIYKDRILSPSERTKRWRQRHPEAVKEYKKKYRLEHLEQERKKNNERNVKHRLLHPEMARERWIRWKYKDVKTAREKVNSYHKSRYFNDLQFRLASRLRGRLSDALRIGKKEKVGSHIRFLGCSLEELKTHLQNQFKEGMSWDNYGKNGWHIDHKQPLSRFDLTNDSQLVKLCHFTNLQPLWAKDNIIKSNKFIYE